MNWMTLLDECLVGIALFTAVCIGLVGISKKHPSIAALNYPSEVVERLIQEGRLQEDKPLPKWKIILKKLPIIALFLAMAVCLFYFWNGCRDFLSGFLSCLILWTVLNWYDALFLDCVLFCHVKWFWIPGTEDLADAYHDSWFHIKGSLFGQVGGTLLSLLVGGAIALLGLF